MDPPTALTNNTSPKSFYEVYLGSPEWHKKREERLRVDDRKCSQCNSEERLNVHHLTYARLGNERIEDLLTLCRDCHEDTHGIATGDFKKFKRRQKGYREIFIERYGQFPHTCYFYGKCHFCIGIIEGYTRPLDRWAAVVHHEDGDPENNDPTNLKPAHHGCHLSHHHKGSTHSAETIDKRTGAIRQAYANRTEEQITATKVRMGAMLRKAWDSPESREKLVRERRERGQSPEEKARLSKMSRAYQAAHGNPWKGKKHNEATRAKIKAARARQILPLLQCPYCGFECKGGGPMGVHKKACSTRLTTDDSISYVLR